MIHLHWPRALFVIALITAVSLGIWFWLDLNDKDAGYRLIWSFGTLLGGYFVGVLTRGWVQR